MGVLITNFSRATIRVGGTTWVADALVAELSARATVVVTTTGNAEVVFADLTQNTGAVLGATANALDTNPIISAGVVTDAAVFKVFRDIYTAVAAGSK